MGKRKTIEHADTPTKKIRVLKEEEENSFGNEQFHNESDPLGNVGNFENDTINYASSPEKEDCQRWSLAEDSALLEAVKNESKNLNISYKLALKKLQYDKVAEALQFRSDEDCKSRLQFLMSPISQIKTLNQMLEDTKANLNKTRTKTMSSGLENWLQKNKEEVEKYKMKHSDKTIKEAANILFDRLSPDEKNKYRKIKSNSPFSIYFESYKKKHQDKNENMIIIRNKYCSMPDERKLKYIERYLLSVINAVRIDELTEDSFKQLNKQEITIYLNHLGVPAFPSKNVFTHYASKKGLSMNIIQARHNFEQLNEKKQRKWTEKFREDWLQFREEYKNWISNQEDYIPLLINKIFKGFSLHLEKNCLSEEEKKVKKPPKKKLVTTSSIKENIKTISMPIGKVSFPGEPTPPPLTEVQIFSQTLSEDDKKNAAKLYRLISPKEKEKINERSLMLKNKYKTKLLTYVESLEEEQKRLFLGLRRFRCIDVLKEDIFVEYPSEDYPMYIKPGKEKKSPSKTVKKQQNPQMISEGKQSPSKAIKKFGDSSGFVGNKQQKKSPTKSVKSNISNVSFNEYDSTSTAEEFLSQSNHDGIPSDFEDSDSE